VSRRRVCIRRMIPLIRNGFKPVFIGKFETRSGQVLLVGTFTVHPFTRVWAALWIGMLTVIVLINTGKGGPNAHSLAVAGIAVLGLGVVRFGNWLSRHDVGWLSSLIMQALSGDNADDFAEVHAENGENLQPEDAEEAGRLPYERPRCSETSMSVFKILVFICELAVVASALTGIRAIYTDRGNLVTIEHTPLTRLGAFLLAGMVAVFLYGLHVRSPLAWRGGWGLLVLMVAIGIANAVDGVQKNAVLGPHEALLFFGISGCLVGVYLGLWWRNQRGYFQ
jgi:hypothetical protein